MSDSLLERTLVALAQGHAITDDKNQWCGVPVDNPAAPPWDPNLVYRGGPLDGLARQQIYDGLLEDLESRPPPAGQTIEQRRAMFEAQFAWQALHGLLR